MKLDFIDRPMIATNYRSGDCEINKSIGSLTAFSGFRRVSRPALADSCDLPCHDDRWRSGFALTI